MKIGSFCRKICYSSWFIAVIPAVIGVLYIPRPGTMYKMTITEEKLMSHRYAYFDLNSDSISEKILLARASPYNFISVQNSEGRIHDQWNLTDSIDENLSTVFFGNYDRDEYQEIYVFTHKRDSLFLNVNEFFDPEDKNKERIFIDRVGFSHNSIAAGSYAAGFFDSNGDNFEEVYFSVTSYYRLGPRRVYSCDLVNGSVDRSPEANITLHWPELYDTDLDHRPEIFGSTNSSGNYPASVPFSDSSTWLMVFNDKLDFEFEPVEFPGYVHGLVVKEYNGSYLAVYNATGASTGELEPSIMIYTCDGRLLRRKKLVDLGITSPENFPLVFKHDQNDRIILAGDRLIEIDSLLEEVNSAEPSLTGITNALLSDIDGNGVKELILHSFDDGLIMIYNEDLQLLCQKNLHISPYRWKISNRQMKNGEDDIYIDATEAGYYLKIERNKLYYSGYLIYPGIFLFFFLFIILIRRINTLQIVQREELKQRLVTLQLQSIKSQLDPHFTFNTLNSVASMIYLENRQSAYDYLNKFTHLLRSMLNDAERIYRRLSEEIDFVTTYLELEKLRFGDKFNYSINVAEGVTQNELVPKLVLHTFVENAIKHGIMPSSRTGDLKIKVEKVVGYLKISVEDNGIGRIRSEGQTSSTGKGLKLTSEFYDILNSINKTPIKHVITDLYHDSGDPAGTKVEIWVPDGLGTGTKEK